MNMLILEEVVTLGPDNYQLFYRCVIETCRSPCRESISFYQPVGGINRENETLQVTRGPINITVDEANYSIWCPKI